MDEHIATETIDKIISSPQSTSSMVNEIVYSILNDIDITEKTFQLTLFFIAFNPLFWNIVARLEHSTHFLTKIAGNNAKRGCYLLAIIIFSLGIKRDLLFEQALKLQNTSSYLTDVPAIATVGIISIVIGQVLVLSSMYQLGITGTYLGDYFNILMEQRVTGFPFNVTNNPMYHGSTLSFLGTSLYMGKPSGLVITAFVWIMYSTALRFEEPFTAKIYAKREYAKSKHV
ncbi:bifunctional phosphatidyl-N-methylethanolamine N-methyltransferase/phosphatidyl-N-dimethylethanolamine N-methyltransferase NDAI_0A03900 [Naumovozyma dairenensis CBS 421]|uniref:Phosphatidyl-N-methylethanolamine N-methyltransferase n=1 Tax=Naumovozyma dairenensis (strain ATCC 10597 / BCRC 20456 / CBS 421 / NBRC 0211 / NRRL Y-12639) TaxID=1071378 RepID=G0W409_NAUDC|nr:hypothetical protein NDAI_0A03900 [Naumovozyma dairenensis CBS 421]CCD22547.1 hypothetical protein NDAI_0A03900 [Naumovozyma dairenensis CBS 421]